MSMTVRDLIDILENYDDDMEVKIGMKQRYGCDFAMNICDDVEVHKIKSFWGSDYKALVITEGEQIGTVDYYGDEDEEDEDWEDE